jgi:cell division protein ZapE
MTAFTTAYHDRLAAGDLRPDPAQEAALSVLEELAVHLEGYKISKQGFFQRFLSDLPPSPKGLYIYGDVGRGKSMLMDLFYMCVNVEKKRRVHFHQFMLEIHDRLHERQKDVAQDILPHIAKDIASETALLCFDEFHVDNIADAMILGRLFEALLDAGVVVVATSNWAPDELYKNGLQRERFLPFIDLLIQRMNVYYLNGIVDHRFEQTQELPCAFYPLSEENTHKLQGIFLQLTEDAEPEPLILPVQGRTLRITHAAKGVGFFNFDELCVAALGPADYLEIAVCLHTILLDGIPRMIEEKRNETLRFINLIDALYEARVKFYFVAEVPLDKLAPSGELNYPFQRALSRLTEMQSEEYRKKPHLVM